MNIKATLVRNVSWNWIGTAFDAGIAFAICPFLIRELGEITYGLWILLGSFTSYFGLLDLGVRSSIGRYLAFYRAEGRTHEMNGILNTALALCAAVGVIALAVALACRPLFFSLFSVPPAEVSVTANALYVVGCSLALSFPLSIFDSSLWSAQRFDLLNIIDITMGAARAVVTFFVIHSGYGLLGLAISTLTLTAVTGLIKGITTFRHLRELRFSRRYVNRAAARELINYGFFTFIGTAARLIRSQMQPILIGSLLGVPIVTLYSVAKRLIDYADRVVVAAAGVATPLATNLHATGQTELQRTLFLQSGRLAGSVALFFWCFCIFLGKPFIVLWMGPSMAKAGDLLAILATGEVLPMSQMVTASVVLGTARHKMFAWTSLLELAVAGALLAILSRMFGVVGSCSALAISSALFRGVFLVGYGCRILGVPVGLYLRTAFGPALIAGMLSFVATASIIRAVPVDNWAGFLTCLGVYLLACSTAGVAVMLTTTLGTTMRHRWMLAAKG